GGEAVALIDGDGAAIEGGDREAQRAGAEMALGEVDDGGDEAGALAAAGQGRRHAEPDIERRIVIGDAEHASVGAETAEADKRAPRVADAVITEARLEIVRAQLRPLVVHGVEAAIAPGAEQLGIGAHGRPQAVGGARACIDDTSFRQALSRRHATSARAGAISRSKAVRARAVACALRSRRDA